MLQTHEITTGDLWPLIEDGAHLVTANRRLARKMAAVYAAGKKKRGVLSWKSPRIYSFTAWVLRLYDTFVMHLDKDGGELSPQVLSEDQERWVWRAVIEASDYGRGLLQAPRTAATAQQAQAICARWRIGEREMEVAPPPETSAFLSWKKAFEKRRGREGWVETAVLPDLVASGICKGHVDLPEHVVFAGFDEVSPQFAELAEAIRSRGTNLCTLSPPCWESHVAGHILADAEDEIAAAARWAEALLAREPAARIGVIVADLETVRGQVVRIFDDILHPRLVLEQGDDLGRAYNISLGPMLATYPLVQAGLQVLEAARPLIDYETAENLLVSPFLKGAKKEFFLRGLASADLREKGETETGWDSIIRVCQKSNASVIVALCRRFKKVLDALPAAQPPALWAESFTGILESLGWPGDRSLSSSERQCLDAWQEALSRFAAMDRVTGGISYEKAFALLKQQVRETPFQPETKDLPVQVMGVLESAGFEFDALWIMGLDSEKWPPAPRPNPLIPFRLQRKYGVSGSSPERELALARKFTGRLFASAPEVHVSFARRQGDAELFASPLAGVYFKDSDAAPSASFRPFWGNLPGSASIEWISDPAGPEIAKDTRMKGGTGLLKDQAACPFRAFAIHRLGAKPLEEPVPGLDARSRGRLVHRCLEHFWRDLKSREALCAQEPANLLAQVEKAVSEAVEKEAAEKPRLFTERFFLVEKARLQELVKEWLELEKNRAPFTVTEQETSFEALVGGLYLRTVADRIDTLADGRLVLIDYKTSAPRTKDWFSERPAEPQLPLYAIHQRGPVAAVLFGQVRKGDMRFLGVADSADTVPGIDPISTESRVSGDCGSLSELMELWRERISALGEEIRAGHAPVAPVSVQESCRFCHIHPICRINERRALKEGS
jgi:probable DNA repair protein